METRIVPLQLAKEEIAASKLVRRLPRYRELFAPVESWAAVDGFALLRSVLPSGAMEHRRLLKAVQALQRLSLVHRNITPETTRGLLGDFGAAVDVRAAFARAKEVLYPVAAPTPVDLQLLVAAAQEGELTRPMLEEICGEPAVVKCYERYAGAPQAVVLRGLLAGWRTWDLYAVARMHGPPESLHYDAAKRPSVETLLNAGTGGSG
jgi:hypothetical protein